MDTETRMLIDILNLYPKVLEALRKLDSPEALDDWVAQNESWLVYFGPNNEWERIKFYAAVNFQQVFEWVKGLVYVE